MLFNEEYINVTIQLGIIGDSDRDGLDRLTQILMTELKNLPIDSIALLNEGTLQPGSKGLDPITWGALGIIVVQAVLPKLLEFLQAWSLRGQNHVLKAKVTDKDGRSIEVEYPLVLGPDEAKKHIQTVMDALEPGKENH